MAEEEVLLEGGSRDGESTVVPEGVRRLLAVSAAPGLLDIYEADGRTRTLDDGTEALVFVLAGQESAEGIAPELLHFPSPAG
jgi:hypothetical protein